MRRRARRGGGRQLEVIVETLGAKGDGLATVDGRPLFLPQTLPGDRVLARVTGERRGELGRASCRERGCPYGWISVVAVSCTKQNYYKTNPRTEHSIHIIA